jgi:hypothetical protein
MERHSSILQGMMSSLIGLIVLNSALLGALFAQVPPNPPGKFGPYITATLALAVVSFTLVYWRSRVGYISSIIVGLMCLLSFGPQKFFNEPTANLLAPVIIIGSIFSVLLIVFSVITWSKQHRNNV